MCMSTDLLTFRPSQQSSSEGPSTALWRALKSADLPHSYEQKNKKIVCHKIDKMNLVCNGNLFHSKVKPPLELLLLVTPLILFTAKEHTIKCPILYNFLVLIFHSRVWWTSLARSIISTEETLADPQTAASVLGLVAEKHWRRAVFIFLMKLKQGVFVGDKNQQEMVPPNGVKVEWTPGWGYFQILSLKAALRKRKGCTANTLLLL